MQAISLRGAVGGLRKIGPYALMELPLPGGTLLAFLLWLSTGVNRGMFADAYPPPIAPIAIERVVCACGSASCCSVTRSTFERC